MPSWLVFLQLVWISICSPLCNAQVLLLSKIVENHHHQQQQQQTIQTISTPLPWIWTKLCLGQKTQDPNKVKKKATKNWWLLLMFHTERFLSPPLPCKGFRQGTRALSSIKRYLANITSCVKNSREARETLREENYTRLNHVAHG